MVTPGSRPLRADARRNRDAVLAAAEAAFGQEGVHVALDEIARRAGVGAGTVYRHFPTKEALFAAILSARFEQLSALADAALAAPDAGAALAGMLDAMVREGHPKRDLIEAMQGAGFDAHASVASARQDLTGRIAKLLAHAQAAGAVRPDIDIVDLMSLLAAMFTAARQTPGDPARARKGFDILLDGLRPPASRHR